MANEEHLEILKQGVAVWNKWRKAHPEYGADFSEANLENLYKEEIADGIDSPMGRQIFMTSKGYGADLSGINLAGGNLWGARLQFVNLSGAVLTNTNFTRANLRYAILNGANLDGATLYEADLYKSSLEGAKLINANLLRASLVDANLKGAILENCTIHGTSVWGVKVDEKTSQKALDISDPNDPGTPAVSVDDIEVAQFISLLLENRRIRRIIDTITSKVVLILGRFSEKRKPVLDQLRDVLRNQGLAPVLFDFNKPTSKDITGTVETLARMARFIVADLTDPSSIPHELATIVPFMRTTPIVPIRLKGSGGYSMFDDFEAAYKWVLPKYEYESDQNLIESVSEKIVVPAEIKVKELRGS